MVSIAFCVLTSTRPARPSLDCACVLEVKPQDHHEGKQVGHLGHKAEGGKTRNKERGSGRGVREVKNENIMGERERLCMCYVRSPSAHPSL